MKWLNGRLLLIFLLVFALIALPGIRAEEDEDKRLYVAVVDFRDNSGKKLDNIGEASSEILGTLLSQTEKFNVLERSKLNAIMTEQGLSMSGLVDSEKSAIQVGKLLGASYIITGSVISLTTNTVKFKGYGVESEKVITEMNVNVKILNIITGKIEYAGLFPAKEEVLNAAASTQSTGTDRKLLTKALKSAVSELVKKIDAKNIKNIEKVLVNFDSEPAGADVEINGVFYGNTPASIALNPGLYEVIISFAGYESWTKKINAVDGLKIKATLAKKEIKDTNDK